jgi:hypothetical protein
MASHFRFFPSEAEVVVPFNARYSFPSQANKSVKMTPRLSPKTGATYIPGDEIRLEFPAQGYVNPANTTIAFDVELIDWETTFGSITRFQNNIQSLFQRVRIMYGSTPLEDIMKYNQIVRMLTEWTGTTQIGTLDQTSISEGIGGVVYGCEADAAQGSGEANPRAGFVNIRQAYIQGIDNARNTTDAAGSGTAAIAANTLGAGNISFIANSVNRGNGFQNVPGLFAQGTVITDSGLPVFLQQNRNRSSTIRRYQISLAAGLFSQEKLLPTKFMASQLAIEITLETAAGCIFTQKATPIGSPAASPTTGAAPTYRVSNVSLIPEILEFDASYDAMFLKGLKEGGVPIKFSSWHTYTFGTGGSSNLNLQIQERSRSVKALFAVQRRAPVSMETDSGAMFLCSNTDGDLTVENTLQFYQFRIGGRYYPAAPVQVSVSSGSARCNGGAEAFVELQKALNVVGDYRLSTGCNVARWGIMPFNTAVGLGGITTTLAESDYAHTLVGYNIDGRARVRQVTYPGRSNGSGFATSANAFSGNMGSQCFAMAIDLEASNGVEISGLNASEQSDIALVATYAKPQNNSFNIEVYCYFDAIMILYEHNMVKLIE